MYFHTRWISSSFHLVQKQILIYTHFPNTTHHTTTSLVPTQQAITLFINLTHTNSLYFHQKVTFFLSFFTYFLLWQWHFYFCYNVSNLATCSKVNEVQCLSRKCHYLMTISHYQLCHFGGELFSFHIFIQNKMFLCEATKRRQLMQDKRESRGNKNNWIQL